MHSQANAPVPTGPLLYQPRFDCRSGELAGAKLYIGRPDGPEKFVLDHRDHVHCGLPSLGVAFLLGF